MAREAEYVPAWNCYCTSYTLRGFDVYKFFDKDLTTFWWVYAPNGGPMVYESFFYPEILEWCREHEKEYRAC